MQATARQPIHIGCNCGRWRTLAPESAFTFCITAEWSLFAAQSDLLWDTVTRPTSIIADGGTSFLLGDALEVDFTKSAAND
jgi:hypothetical protein